SSSGINVTAPTLSRPISDNKSTLPLANTVDQIPELGAGEALKAHNKSSIPVFGVDALPEGCFCRVLRVKNMTRTTSGEAGGQV
ncbi:hypothetical protein O5853_31055, partial [Escherichia coli]|nr:hypothetical protein [Escherichia coli]